ncbi:MAG: serine/threonine protein phosphatase [Desulfovibrio sp.]|jgi:hypothetical protein|nr:serine/threonine protein phosphatase [Desulfovibrio sp.]
MNAVAPASCRFPLRFYALLALCALLLATPLWAASQNDAQKAKTPVNVKIKQDKRETQKKKTADKSRTQRKKSVYDNQPAITENELTRFLEAYPQFRDWRRANNEISQPTVRDGKADFIYSKQAGEWVNARGWQADRFFCVMGRLATALVIVEEGNDLDERPRDMPDVAKEDIELTRKHLGAILKALDKSESAADPIGK